MLRADIKQSQADGVGAQGISKKMNNPVKLFSRRNPCGQNKRFHELNSMRGV